MSILLRRCAFAVLAVVGFAASSVSAATISFERITDNSAIDASSQLLATTSDDTTRALFNFTVLSGAQMDATIAEIYFEDTLSIFTPPPVIVFESTGVSYVAGSASPGNLPGGNDASPPFVATAGLLADNAPGNENGINVDELLTLGLNYAFGFGFDDVIAALESGNLRIGLHVRSLAGGESDSFVNTPTPIPLPAGGILLITALGGLGVAARRRRKSS